MPPTRRIRVAGHEQQYVARAFVRDAVPDEQVGDVALLESDLAEFHATDLRLGAADQVPGLLAADTPGLPEPAELGAQEHPGHGRSSGRAVILLRRRHLVALRTLAWHPPPSTPPSTADKHATTDM